MVTDRILENFMRRRPDIMRSPPTGQIQMYPGGRLPPHLRPSGTPPSGHYPPVRAPNVVPPSTRVSQHSALQLAGRGASRLAPPLAAADITRRIASPIAESAYNRSPGYQGFGESLSASPLGGLLGRVGAGLSGDWQSAFRGVDAVHGGDDEDELLRRLAGMR